MGHLSVVQYLWTQLLEARFKGKRSASEWVIVDDKGRILDESVYGESFERGPTTLRKKCPRNKVIILMLDCGYLRRDAEAAIGAIRDLAGEDCSYYLPYRWAASWFIALHDSCKSGELECVKWLIQHPMSRRVIELIKRGKFRDDLISAAAGEGHWKIVQYLCEQQITKYLILLLDLAIRNGHVKCVEYPIDTAAQYGRLEVVQFLYNFSPRDSLAIRGVKSPSHMMLGGLTLVKLFRGLQGVVTWSYQMGAY
ncbi:hypothetical protein JG688_00006718 [Phytophthora aleatoria]|uniref:Ankyrin repeat-containing domain n=1 Tax=Phytophthora aleatoria TaxID=2496075 RepID=A0A8J5M5N8_9STRA|nr:hypothetical protein JG688_00006718 [Phytophthora aleatoria]